MEATLKSIFCHAYPAYAKRNSIPLHKHKAARAIMECRTKTLGGHVQCCPHGHIEGIWYNSCKNRSCPQCSGLPTERWLEKAKARLLPSDHYHAIFTLPHRLIALWWANNRLMADLLFHSASETLMELLGDENHLGAKVGLIASLHTWGRNQSQHPHLHCLVSGGGLNGAGEWLPITNGYLLPFRVVRTLFRGKYLAALRQAYREGKLRLPKGLNEEGLHKLLNRLRYRVKWNVHIRERYPHGRGVMTYLARYVKGGPISNRNILKADDAQVIFRYRDHREHKTKILPLKPEHFLQRILWHIPEPGQHSVRYYGLYGHQAKAQRDRCREQLGQPPEQEPEPLTWQTYWERLGKPEMGRCPVCRAPLITTMEIPRATGPPLVIPEVVTTG